MHAMLRTYFITIRQYLRDRCINMLFIKSNHSLLGQVC